MPEKPQRETSERFRPLLRRADQAALAAMVLASLVAMGGYWWANGGFEGRLIEIERAKPQAADFIVDVNRADWPELAQLPGIGETLAKRIVEVRTSGGPFRDHEEVQLRVRGIGPKTLQKIKPYLTPIADDAMVAGK